MNKFKGKLVLRDEKLTWVYNFEGKKIITMDEPYCDGDLERAWYCATGVNVDDEDEMFEMIWQIVEGYQPEDAEENACDWAHPYSIRQTAG